MKVEGVKPNPYLAIELYYNWTTSKKWGFHSFRLYLIPHNVKKVVSGSERTHIRGFSVFHSLWGHKLKVIPQRVSFSLYLNYFHYRQKRAEKIHLLVRFSLVSDFQSISCVHFIVLFSIFLFLSIMFIIRKNNN